MSWRRFAVLLGGLAVESRWHVALRQDKAKPQVLEGTSLDAWMQKQKRGRSR